ncbi:MAG: DMT family transporter [archaeon]|nr:MAG: DMT family transporter [archaeon]
MFSPVYALVAAVIWAFSPIYYRTFLEKFGFLNLNLVRTSTAAAVLFVPALLVGFGPGLLPALLGGVITLGCGDSLFLLSIRETGASVAAPVVYTYVLLVQLTAGLVGEAVPGSNFLAAGMVIVGVFFLSRGGEGKPRAKGIAFALGAALAWTAGQDLVRVATTSGGDPVVVAFSRNAAAAAALALAVIATGRARKWPRGLVPREIGLMGLIIISDLVVGSLIFVYSIAALGVALTVILTSLSPALTQALSKVMGKESPSPRDFAGGALIVAALVLAVVY